MFVGIVKIDEPVKVLHLFEESFIFFTEFPMGYVMEMKKLSSCCDYLPLFTS